MAKQRAKTVITTHNNADFDALAAMVAASKLYDGATLVFPGSQEKTLRNFYIQSATYLFDFKNAKDIDPASVRTLVLVDTRQASRLGHINKILERRDDLAVHAYDHHPDSDDDVPHSRGIVEPWGATTSILIGEMRERGVTLSGDEATILGCGIYEDTGSFTFTSTTEHDFLAAAWLRTQGMDISVIADLLERDLTTEQVAILNTLLESAATHEINGVPIVIAEVSLDYYMGDFALLVHKMLDMENIRVLFALGRMQDRIHVVSRSRTPEVDVGTICTSLGGGGHAFAASATVKDRSLPQVKDELFALLYSHINPQHLVRDLMSRPAVTIDTDSTIDQAVEVMARYGFKAIPVVDPGTRRVAGLLEHQIADKAQAHGLGDVRAAEYMQRDCQMINPHADLYPVIEIIVGQRQRMLPVVEDGELVGVITRTDLINILIEEPARIPETLLPERNRERNIRSILRERLPDPMYGLLETAGELAEEKGYAVYAVGGFVRDILLRRTNLDLDLVVEGDGIAFARALSRRLGCRVRSHKKFKTAVVICEEQDQRIDVATARLEYYEYPAALPTVELSSIKMDLFRRDFTVNALAVQLNPGQMGRLVDFFGAQRDIKEHVIRVLHSLSFVEDPTRILRCIRFAQRFNFRIGGQTQRLIKNAMQLELIKRLSGARVFHELRLIMEEANPVGCLRHMHEFGLLAAIHPLLELDNGKDALLVQADKVLSWYRLLYLEPEPRAWRVYFLALSSGGEEQDVRDVCRRLALSKRQENDIMNTRGQMLHAADKLYLWNRDKGPLSRLHEILSAVPLEGALHLMARTRLEPVRKSISLYLTQLRGVDIKISGDDLIAMGLEPGPRVGEVLQRVLAAKLDGQAPTLLAEIAVAEDILRREGTAREARRPREE
jgi:tRNA nucleotidyltransferase (CCA-adding enzyme)